MKQIGYMVIKFTKKSITVCLFNESKEELEWAIDTCGFNGVDIFPCYEDESGKQFIKKEGETIRI